MALKFYNYDIVFQEIPDEVTLAVNLTGCPHHCEGCHSPHLQRDTGIALDEEALNNLLSQYGQQITCFCFMGGDANPQELSQLATYLRQKTKLKIAWYSGNSNLPDIFTHFDYVKTGPYISQFGGLKSPTTNQRLYRIRHSEAPAAGSVPEDITRRFWRSNDLSFS